MSRFFDCTVIGDVFFDVIAQKPSWQNCVYRGGVSEMAFAKITHGGGGNVAVGMSLFGLTTAFIGKAGNDVLGEMYDSDLKLNSVVSKLIFDDSLPTGIAISFIEPNGERSFEVFRGANSNLTDDEITKNQQLIEESKYLYIVGYSIISENQKKAILRAIEIAKRAKTKIAFDPGAHNIIAQNKTLCLNLIKSSDILCLNFEEACELVGTRDIDLIITKLQQWTNFSCLKLGGEGSVMMTKSRIIKSPAYEVDAIDTTGAGDAFISAVIYGECKRLSLELISDLANWYASKVVSNVGARGFPRKDEILTHLKHLQLAGP
ncbi:MAG: carbohydrate kinase family protein [Candidatus Bathyarchaeota archaeon]|nr:carbohydrate kinase family protein [Candidatus Bathyarchaeota archaeon]